MTGNLRPLENPPLPPGQLTGTILAEHPGVLSEERTLAVMFPSGAAAYSRRVPRYLGRQPYRHSS